MVPLWLLSIPLDDISIYAKKYKLDPLLVASIVKVESNGESCATRFEPKWIYMYYPSQFKENLGISLQTEETHQKTSWGLMQVMGSVARELGYSGHLVRLCNPDEGLDYGCKKLRQLFDRYYDVENVVSAYNQGSPRKTPGGLYFNEKYVDKVMGYYRELTSLESPTGVEGHEL